MPALPSSTPSTKYPFTPAASLPPVHTRSHPLDSIHPSRGYACTCRPGLHPVVARDTRGTCSGAQSLDCSHPSRCEYTWTCSRADATRATTTVSLVDSYTYHRDTCHRHRDTCHHHRDTWHHHRDTWQARLPPSRMHMPPPPSYVPYLPIWEQGPEWSGPVQSGPVRTPHSPTLDPLLTGCHAASSAGLPTKQPTCQLSSQLAN